MAAPNINMDNLQNLQSRMHIEDTLARASRAIDRLDVDLLKSVFWDDATDDRGVVRGNAHEMAPDLINFCKTRFATTQHILCNCSIELDGNSAASETYVVAWHRLQPDIANLDFLYGAEFVQSFRQRHAGALPDEFVVGARYLDRHECRDNDWKILSRANALAWCDIRSASPWPTAGAFAGSNSFETRDKGDMAYRFLRK